VANLRHDKDYPNLIAAIEILAEKRSDFVLRIVGKGPLREEIEERASHLIERGLVQMLGPRSDVIQLMADSDVFVLSSSREGLPVVIMEALAAGLPIVSTAVGGIPELVGEGGAAVLVAPGDPVALARALSGLLGDGSRLSEMSQACLLASEQVNIDYAARSIESLYQVRQ
jgi:glycosyltransferase involved in cell wall biosynthesis